MWHFHVELFYLFLSFFLNQFLHLKYINIIVPLEKKKKKNQILFF